MKELGSEAATADDKQEELELLNPFETHVSDMMFTDPSLCM